MLFYSIDAFISICLQEEDVSRWSFQMFDWSRITRIHREQHWGVDQVYSATNENHVYTPPTEQNQR